MEPTPREPPSDEDTMRPEYDFSKMRGGQRGKYAERMRAQEPTVRILHNDGTVTQCLLSEMKKKLGTITSPASADDDMQNVTFVAVPNELVPQVQELIARGQKSTAH